MDDQKWEYKVETVNKDELWTHPENPFKQSQAHDFSLKEGALTIMRRITGIIGPEGHIKSQQEIDCEQGSCVASGPGIRG